MCPQCANYHVRYCYDKQQSVVWLKAWIWEIHIVLTQNHMDPLAMLCCKVTIINCWLDRNEVRDILNMRNYNTK